DRDEQEEQPGPEQHERREPDRVERDHAEGEVDRRGDLAVGDREERARVELAAEPRELAGYLDRPRRRHSRPAPAATKSAPIRYPVSPPPCSAVTTSSANPSPTVTSASTRLSELIVSAPVPPGHGRCQARSQKCNKRSTAPVSIALLPAPRVSVSS